MNTRDKQVPVEIRGTRARPVPGRSAVADPVLVPERAVHLAPAPVEIGLAVAVAVLIETEGGAILVAVAVLGAVGAELAGPTGQTLPCHVVAGVAGGRAVAVLGALLAEGGVAAAGVAEGALERNEREGTVDVCVCLLGVEHKFECIETSAN